jgi:hypothetical protein
MLLLRQWQKSLDWCAHLQYMFLLSIWRALFEYCCVQTLPNWNLGRNMAKSAPFILFAETSKFCCKPKVAVQSTESTLNAPYLLEVTINIRLWNGNLNDFRGKQTTGV